MMIFKKAIARRTFLQGLGATVALPLLDGMVPAFARAIDTAAKPVMRLSAVYFPTGFIQDAWVPADEGTDYKLSPIMQPLAPFRDRVLVLSNLSLRNADPILANEGGLGNHSRASSSWLSGVHPKRTEGSDLEAGTTLDQMVAAEYGKKTPLPSLEVAYEEELIGDCERGYSCAYLNTLSWRTPTTPMPMETQPRLVFERLFGDGDSAKPEDRLARLRENRSILDRVSQEAGPFMRELGGGDRVKLGQYFDAVRDIEQRIQRAEQQGAKELPTSMMQQPVDLPETYEAYSKLMFDLQVVAYQADLTRVISTMMAREQSLKPYPEIGIADAHHPLTHHNGDTDKIAKVIRINTFHVKMLVNHLERLQSTPDGDGTLLDHTTLICGSAIGDGNLHTHANIPVFLLPAKQLQMQTGKHVKYPNGTPLPNLYLTLLDKLNMPVEKMGNSTGRLAV